jgi:ADP-sugar diphosphatase
VLMILRPHGTKDERYVVMTEQPRIPAGSLQFLEIPAGMLDGKTHFSGKAAEEIAEETGMRIPKEELIDMTELALRESAVRDKSLKNAMYPSPGGSDEFIPILLWEKVSVNIATW